MVKAPWFPVVFFPLNQSNGLMAEIRSISDIDPLALDAGRIITQRPCRKSALVLLVEPQFYWDVPEKKKQFINGGFLSHGGTPSHHPNFSGIFPEINHPAYGVPLFLETPKLMFFT